MMIRLILRLIRVTPKHDYIDRVTFTDSKNMTDILMPLTVSGGRFLKTMCGLQ